jgi:hypothetical protein
MTTTVLRPNATISGTPTGAATVHAALSDDSDSSYTDGLAQVQLATVAMSGGVTKTIRARFRESSTGAAIAESDATFYGSLKLSTGTTVVDVSELLVATADRLTVSSVVVPVSLTQAQVDGLTAEAAARPESMSSSVRTYEVYADLVWVAKPVATVTAVTPDPYTASNIVPISWTRTLDADGGAQSRYWVKVFTAAQYGAGGFNPETSTPYWESGNTVSGATSTSTDVLANSTTYRAYVKIAQTVNGASHWSDWAFDQFAVSVTTSDVLTVVPVASDGTASITVTVNRNTGSAAWDFVEVQRSTDAGATWSDVRGATYVDATGHANTFNVTDYETANGQSTLYRARATRLVSDLPIAGEWVQSTPAVSWSSDLCWIKAPSDPSLNQAAKLRIRPATFRARIFGAFRVLGSSTPVVVSDALSTPTSTIEILQSVSDSSLVPLLSQSVLLIHPPASWYVDTMYFAPTGVEYEPGEFSPDTRAFWRIDAMEVDAPGDPDASAP